MMAFNGWDQDNYGHINNGYGNHDSSSYDMDSLANFGEQQQFQSFDYSTEMTQHPTKSSYGKASTRKGKNFNSGPAIMTPGPNFFTPDNSIMNAEPSHEDFGEDNHLEDSFENEPPLLEELGINPDHIVQKTLAVMHPFRMIHDPRILQDTDLAGPLSFCLTFGGFLLLSGKISFGHIYGIGLLGCIAIYGLLNMMSMTGVEFSVVVSVLGYCILPMVGVAGVNVLISLQGVLGMILVGTAVIWCSISSSKLFVTALHMERQQPLVAYPCALLYGVFALITIF